MSGHASWRTRVVVLLGLWAAVALVAWLAGNQPQPGLLALVLAVAAAALWLLLDLSGGTGHITWPQPVEDPVRPPGEDTRLALLHHMVVQHHDAHEVGDAVHRELTRLADQRLVTRHGVSFRSDPDRAVSLLGPELAAVATAAPPYPRLSDAQIQTLLDRIEDL